jgi:mono/diheme cytochrome c family protein
MYGRVVGSFALTGLAAAWTVLYAAGPQSHPAGPALSPISDLQPVLSRYCFTCHNSRAKTGGLALDAVDLANIPAGAEVWEKVVRKLQAGAMPPLDAPHPDQATLDRLRTTLVGALDQAAAAAPNPGRPTLARLNRTQYANAVHDLLALDVDPALLLPPDDSSSGFDNNADVLGVSPLLLEAYLSAARKVSSLAVGDPATSPNTATYRAAPDSTQTGHIEGLPFGTRGGLLAHHTFPLDGEYVITVKLLETTLSAIRGLEFSNRVEVLLDGRRVHQADVGGDKDFVGSTVNTTNVVKDVEARLTVRVPVKAGEHAVATDFVAKTAAEGGGRLQDFLRANVDTTDHTGEPQIESMTIAGPFNPTGSGTTASRRRIFICRPQTAADDDHCAQRIVATLARRAYRREPTDVELKRLMAFYRAGRQDGPFDMGVQRALQSILASPKFVFRGESVPATGAAKDAPYYVSDGDLASRLSFFLWSTIPDDDLLDAARQGRLRGAGALEQQVKRMLADPRADTLVSNFASQWLELRNLRATIPDQNEFPDFDDNLRQAFRQEAELFFESVVREDRNVLDLLSADYTFVNERLAKHYGIPHVYGSHFRRVTLTDNARRGLLGKGAILLVTSHPDRTSPVVRGKWILENLLGMPPPPPPPNIPALPEGAAAKVKTMRQQMEAHRANPSCAACHRMLDPLGFALENFDAVGAWRVRDAGAVIDASGRLMDGTEVTGVVTLREALLERPDVFVRTLVEKLLTYALGRSLDYRDAPAVRTIVGYAAAHSYRFSSIVMGIVTSVPFQMRMSAPSPAVALNRSSQ